MLRRFRPFQSSWSIVLVLGAVLFTLAACNESPAQENTPGGDCVYNPANNTCT